MTHTPIRGQQLPAGWRPGDDFPPLPGLDLLLTNRLAPGDVVVMTAAIACLHEQWPDTCRTWVDTTAPEIWEGNPDVQAGPPPAGAKRVEMHYPLIHKSNSEPRHFLEGYCATIGRATGFPVRLSRSNPALYLTDDEKGWLPQAYEDRPGPFKYWVLNAGTKTDFTTKRWGRKNYQALVDRLRGVVTFVQVGEAGHDHPDIDGAIDFRGKTSVRELMRLVYHSSGAVGPTTFLQHLAAGFSKPYVCILGGREPVSWVQYPKQTTLHTIGALPCCQEEACWRSRTVPLHDGQEQDDSLCHLPVYGSDPIPTCMALIGVEDVARAILRYVHGNSVTP